jgi:hypothetical protein
VARSAQHEVHVEQNHNGAGFLCTLRQKFQFDDIRMGSGICVFLMFFPFQETPFIAETGQFRGFDTFMARTGNTILILYSRTFFQLTVTRLFLLLSTG